MGILGPPTPPKWPPKPPKGHLGSPGRTSKSGFLPFCCFLIFSLEHGPFFSTLSPTSLDSFLDFHTFSRSFLWLETAKKLGSVKIFPFFCLGPKQKNKKKKRALHQC